jgi:sugar/nucleoside kinase (ribokinase family)
VTPYDILVLGEINVDLILTAAEIKPVPGQERLVDEVELTMGSSSVIFACGAARLGLKVAFAGVVGDDEFGRFMLRGMAARNIDVTPVRVDPALKTGITVSLSTPIDRAMLTYAGSISALEAEDVDRGYLDRTRHLHVSSFYLQDRLRAGLPAFLAKARECGLSTSLDPGYDPREIWDSGLRETLAHVDVLMPNEVEAAAITGETSPEAALSALARQIPVSAVKLGAKGAIAQRGRETVRATPPAVETRDTTGAGDSFDAGFVYGYLACWPLARTLRLACTCGALATRVPGGTNGQPTLGEALAVMKEH